LTKPLAAWYIMAMRQKYRHRYNRGDALAEGVLVDVSDIAASLDFRLGMTLTGIAFSIVAGDLTDGQSDARLRRCVRAAIKAIVDDPTACHVDFIHEREKDDQIEELDLRVLIGNDGRSGI